MTIITSLICLFVITILLVNCGKWNVQIEIVIKVIDQHIYKFLNIHTHILEKKCRRDN